MIDRYIFDYAGVLIGKLAKEHGISYDIKTKLRVNTKETGVFEYVIDNSASDRFNRNFSPYMYVFVLVCKDPIAKSNTLFHREFHIPESAFLVDISEVNHDIHDRFKIFLDEKNVRIKRQSIIDNKEFITRKTYERIHDTLMYDAVNFNVTHDEVNEQFYVSFKVGDKDYTYDLNNTQILCLIDGNNKFLFEQRIDDIIKNYLLLAAKHNKKEYEKVCVKHNITRPDKISLTHTDAVMIANVFNVEYCDCEINAGSYMFSDNIGVALKDGTEVVIKD